jgi:ABC-type glutathione transport system ATPase component
MNPQFTTPEEEISFLRRQIQEKMERAKGFEHRFTEKDRANEVVQDYRSTPLEKVIAPHVQLSGGEKHRLIEWLSPRDTD